MPWGFVAAAAVGAAGSIIGSGEQASADEQAANTQAQMFNTIVGQEQPYMTSGNNAETTLNQLLGTSAATGRGGTATGTNLPGGYLTQTFDPTQAQLEAYPGYQFQLNQGDQAVQNSAAASTGAVSGAALKSLSNYNQGLAASNYQNYFNQFQTQQNNIFNRLSSIASLGQNAASNTGNSGAQLGTGVAQAQAASGAATAAGITGATSNIASGGNTLAGLMYLNGANGSFSGLPSGSSYVSGTPYGSGANTGDTYCDYALKTGITRAGVDGASALPVYDFWYVGQDQSEPKWRGYIAQDVMKAFPDAVGRGPKGYWTVDHTKVPSEYDYPVKLLESFDG